MRWTHQPPTSSGQAAQSMSKWLSRGTGELVQEWSASGGQFGWNSEAMNPVPKIRRKRIFGTGF